MIKGERRIELLEKLSKEIPLDRNDYANLVDIVAVSIITYDRENPVQLLACRCGSGAISHRISFYGKIGYHCRSCGLIAKQMDSDREAREEWNREVSK